MAINYAILLFCAHDSIIAIIRLCLQNVYKVLSIRQIKLKLHFLLPNLDENFICKMYLMLILFGACTWLFSIDVNYFVISNNCT